MDNPEDRILYKATLLANMVYSSSEAVRIDYRRREDLLLGLKAQLLSLWEKESIIEGHVVKKNFGTRQKIEVLVFLAGLAINWLTTPDGSMDWHSGFGASLSVMAAISFAIFQVEQLVNRWELEKLQAVENAARFQWISAGAHEDDFGRFKRLHNAFSAVQSGEAAPYREAETLLENHILNVRRSLLSRASGAMPEFGSWPDKASDIDLPSEWVPARKWA